MIDSSTMIILSALFGAVVGNVGVWLYWLNVERKDKKRFEAEVKWTNEQSLSEVRK